MSNVALVLTHGFEEIEAVAVVDILRRAGLHVVIASLDGQSVVGAREIRLGVDTGIDLLRVDELAALVLPGGAPNAKALRDEPRVIDLLRQMAEAGKIVAAICAAPIALHAAGLLDGRKATSYPGFELPKAEYLTERVVEDGQVITSRGPGTVFEFALTLVRRLVGAAKATELRQAMLIQL